MNIPRYVLHEPVPVDPDVYIYKDYNFKLNHQKLKNSDLLTGQMRQNGFLVDLYCRYMKNPW